MHKSKIRKLICLCVTIVLVSLVLTACGNSKLSGTYRSEGLIAQTFTFKDDNVTMSAFGINANGTYKIDGDKIVITYTLFGQSYDWEQPFSKSGSTITIGGTNFIKQ